MLLKNLHLDALNEKVHTIYSNKGIDAYFYTISELIYCLFMYQISLNILYVNTTRLDISFLFAISFCIVCCQKRSVSAHFARSDEKFQDQSKFEICNEFFGDQRSGVETLCGGGVRGVALFFRTEYKKILDFAGKYENFGQLTGYYTSILAGTPLVTVKCIVIFCLQLFIGKTNCICMLNLNC